MKRKREEEPVVAKDCLRHCFSFLDMRDIPILAQVCKGWSSIVKSPRMDLHLCTTDAPQYTFMNVKPLCAKAYATFRNSYPRIHSHSVFLTGHPKLFCLVRKLPHERIAFMSKEKEEKEEANYLRPFVTSDRPIVSCLFICGSVVCDDFLYSVTSLILRWKGSSSFLLSRCPNLQHLFLTHFGSDNLVRVLATLSSPTFTNHLQSLCAEGKDFDSLLIPRPWSTAIFKKLNFFVSKPGLIPFPNVSHPIKTARYGPIMDWKHDVFGDQTPSIQRFGLEIGANVPFCRHFLPKKSADLCRLDLVFQSIRCIEFKCSVQKVFDDFPNLDRVIIQVRASDKWPLITGVMENRRSVGIRGKGSLPLTAIPPFLAPCFHGSMIVDGDEQLAFLTDFGMKPSEVIVTSNDHNAPQALPSSVKTLWLLDGAEGLADLWKREIRDLGVSLFVGHNKKIF